jgi:DNA-binding CsgD family transcriptional regulator
MKAEPLALSPSDRAELQRVARSASLPHRSVRQAYALLWAAEGVPNEEIARRSGVDPLRRWRSYSNSAV